jgi:uncharacterized membrane protein YdcZ (DUF606 family)
MSLASIADARIQRQRQAQPRRGVRSLVTVRSARAEGAPDADRAKPKRDITPLPGATDLARYVPTEAIALYIPILAGAFSEPKAPTGKELHEADFSSRWWFFLGALVGTLALTYLIYAAKKRSEAGGWKPRKDIPVFEMTVALVAMAAWSVSLPDSPLLDFEWYGGWIAPVVLLGSTLLIPLVAAALGKIPPVYVEEVDDEG